MCVFTLYTFFHRSEWELSAGKKLLKCFDRSYSIYKIHNFFHKIFFLKFKLCNSLINLNYEIVFQFDFRYRSMYFNFFDDLRQLENKNIFHLGFIQILLSSFLCLSFNSQRNFKTASNPLLLPFQHRLAMALHFLIGGATSTIHFNWHTLTLANG